MLALISTVVGAWLYKRKARRAREGGRGTADAEAQAE
jgi:hypothetical protein